MNLFKRFIPLIIIIALMAVGYFTGFYKGLNFETLRYHHHELTEYVNNHPVMTPFMFIGAYFLATTLSIPGALFLSLLGGFLFSEPWSTLYVLIGGTGGATCLFLAARNTLGGFLKEKRGRWLSKIQASFNENAVSYMLFFRFIPLLPFWLTNLAPAFFNVRLKTYIWTTFVGITPRAFIFTEAGRGQSSIFESSEPFLVSSVLNTNEKIGLMCLAFFSIIPILTKKWGKKKGEKSNR